MYMQQLVHLLIHTYGLVRNRIKDIGLLSSAICLISHISSTLIGNIYTSNFGFLGQ